MILLSQITTRALLSNTLTKLASPDSRTLLSVCWLTKQSRLVIADDKKRKSCLSIIYTDGETLTLTRDTTNLFLLIALYHNLFLLFAGGGSLPKHLTPSFSSS
jgi:hypothetical protein